MRKQRTHIGRVLAAAVALAVILWATGAAGQGVPEPSGQPETPDPPRASEIPEPERPPGLPPLNMLGITSMHCTCSIIYKHDEAEWAFQSEPVIRAVDKDGPSHGKLKKGDVIVAIDGALITMRKAGIAFANIEEGEPVELTIRRSGRTRDVVIVPRADIALAVALPVPAVPALTDYTRYSELANLSRSIEELSKLSVELSTELATIELPGLPSINLDFGEMFPEGWVGFGLSFSGNIRQKDEDEPAEWRFNDPPTIESVQPDSPADEAGLQVGDELLEIDELKMDSRKGGDRFSRMQPGQVVEWKVRRGGKTFTVETRAEERPVPDLELAVPYAPTPPDSQPVWYTGTVAGAEVEIRGGGDHVSVEVDEETGDIIIRTRDSVVRVKAKKQ
jgi:hypothetical protein